MAKKEVIWRRSDQEDCVWCGPHIQQIGKSEIVRSCCRPLWSSPNKLTPLGESIRIKLLALIHQLKRNGDIVKITTRAQRTYIGHIEEFWEASGAGWKATSLRIDGQYIGLGSITEILEHK